MDLTTRYSNCWQRPNTIEAGQDVDDELVWQVLEARYMRHGDQNPRERACDDISVQL
jgi:hypothetical protein